MTRAAFVQGRVLRMMRQTYVSEARQAVETIGWGTDEWGNPVSFDASDNEPGTRKVAASVQLSGSGTAAQAQGLATRPCQFIDKGTAILGPGGPIQVDSDMLVIAYNDPLQVGDEVRNVTDPSGIVLFAGPATVTVLTSISSGGSQIYMYASITKGEVQ